VQKATVFATGSWDDQENELSIWHVNEGADDNMTDDDEMSQPAVDGEPALVSSAAHRGDVSDLLFLEHDNIVTASSCGSVFVYKYDQRLQTVRLHHTFDKLHRYRDGSLHYCPCTAVACRADEMIASVGEDGRLNVLALETARTAPALVRSIEGANSCSLNAVCFLTQSEIAAVNSVGQFKIWDTRQASDDPVRIFVLTGERIPLHCMDPHPAQHHIVATGGHDGTLYLWDMRQEKYPITLLAAHSSSMWEVHFHPSHPTHLFSCSNDGSLWHWDSSEARLQPIGMAGTGSVRAEGAGASLLGSSTLAPSIGGSANTTIVNSWLMGDAARRHLVVKDLFAGNTVSVNSLDVSGSTLLCGTDGEQICVMKGLVVC
jgi:nuclear pore complex protein Nup43